MTYPCVVSGSFDPFTNGHLNLVTEALDLFSRVDIVVAQNVVRGLRNTTDFEYEHSVDLVQRKLSAIKTVYLITPRELTEVSSSLIKTLCPLNGWEKIVKDYVPPAVMNRLVKKMC